MSQEIINSVPTKWPQVSQFLKIASIDSTTEAPIIATELATDPAAPASGPDAGANDGLRSWAEATAAKTKTQTKNNFIVVADDDAIVIVKPLKREEKLELKNSGKC